MQQAQAYRTIEPYRDGSRHWERKETTTYFSPCQPLQQNLHDKAPVAIHQ